MNPELDQFKARVDSLTEEWLRESKTITAEFSTSPDHLHEKHLYLQEVNRGVSFNHGAEWRIHLCSTCQEHNPDNPYHVELIDLRYE